MLICQHFFSLVAAYSTESQDYVIPDGKQFVIGTCYGEAANSPETEVAVIYDPLGVNQVVFATHGSSTNSFVKFPVIGDGIKMIRILLINSGLTQIRLGGGWHE